MKLIIAEKPELASDIAKAMMAIPRKNTQGYFEDENYAVVSSFGHLLDLAEPEEYNEKYANRNDISILPICFDNWKKVAPKEDYKLKRLNLIGSLINDKKFDGIIHAGDPDDEGQNLIDELLDFFHYTGTVYRIYVNDSIAAHIQKEFSPLKLNDSNMKHVGDAAYARQMADKAFGINESRLANVRLHTYGSIGRVQTPTLGLVVNRDEQIEKHIEQKYFELTVYMNLCPSVYNNIPFKFVPADHILNDEKYIFDKSVLERISKTFSDFKRGITIDNKIEYQYSKLPYNQTELSADMNIKFGYSLKETLDITQALRDKYKIISYNRSDCQYLKEDHFTEAPDVLKTVFKNLDKSWAVDTTIKSKCFDDTKVSAHHGIIPVQQDVKLSLLNKDEQNVYIAICERYIMQFMKPITRMVSFSSIDTDYGILKYTAKKIMDEGFSAFFPISKKDNDEEDCFVEAGDYTASANEVEIKEKKTSPLKYYTPASLVKDMCSISKYVKDEEIKNILKEKDKDKEGEKGSIGTVATRAAIIETLLKREYLEMKGKNIVSTKLGRDFFKVLPDNIKSADITAQWWLIQEQIKNGSLDCNALIDRVALDFKKRVDTAYVGKSLSLHKSEDKEVIGQCPMCGKPVYEAKTKKGLMWYCSDYKNGCKFKMYEYTKRFNDTIKLNKTKVKKLLSNGGIEATLTSKEGKPYKTTLGIQINGDYVNLTIKK